MEKSLMYYRSLILACSFLALSCQKEEWYKKEFTDTEKVKLSKQLLAGSGYYYQGTVPEQFILDESLLHNPDNADTWRELSAATVKRGLAKEAMATYAKAIASDPAKWQGWRGYLYLYFYRDFESAIADFDATDTLTLDFTDYPQGQSVDYMRGIAYYGLKDYSSAEKYFSRYINEVTRDEGEEWVDVYAFLYRALSYENMEKPDSAILDFNTGLKYSPNLSDFYYHKSRVLHKAGDSEEALKMIQEAKNFFEQGYFHQRPYVEVLAQIYLSDIEDMEKRLSLK